MGTRRALSSHSYSYTTLSRLVGLYAHADRAVERWLAAGRLGIEGLLQAALSTQEKTELTIRLYDVLARDAPSTLYAWEQEWFRTVLPEPPARILLAAAGGGRELGWLCDRGYEVDAFEPAAGPAATLQRTAAGRASAARASFDDLADAVLRGRPNVLLAVAAQRYQAVILGWGSLTHVLDASARSELLDACDRLTPEGPILASFWLRSEGPGVSRARAAGATLGRYLSRIRGVRSATPEGQVFRPHAGFCHEFTCDEIEALARATGRRVSWGPYDYPHATFIRAPR